MINALLTSAALMGTTALASGLGKAVVVNNCNYDVSLSNVPASGGGYSNIDQKLSPGGTYTQTWTPLSNTMGWSIKLFKGQDMSNLLQYEYTCHDDGIIWYDLSEVNGNPWDQEGWMIEGSPGCTPRQAAYRHPTDDAYGMQDCPDDSTITVTVCADSSGSGSPSSPAESSAPSSTPSDDWDLDTNAKVVEDVESTLEDKKDAPKAPKTLEKAPVAEKPEADGYRDPNAVYVTNVHTVHVTHTVTATGRNGRHTHHPRHARNHR